jgi:hypothetical protein
MQFIYVFSGLFFTELDKSVYSVAYLHCRHYGHSGIVDCIFDLVNNELDLKRTISFGGCHNAPPPKSS